MSQRPESTAPRKKPSASEPPVFVPYYWRDWLSDQAVQALSFDLQGRLHGWWCLTQGSKKPGVTTEDELRRAMKLTPARWAKCRDAVAACFKVGRDGTWKHLRTIEHRNAMKRRLNAARSSGKKGSRKRWKDKEKDRVPISGGMAEGVANGYPRQRQSQSQTGVLTPCQDSNAGDSRSPAVRLTANGRETDVGRLVGGLAERLAMPERGGS